MSLSGYVLNNSSGVVIEAEGEGAETFAKRLRDGLPPLARIDSLVATELEPAGLSGFEIRLSEPVPGEFALVSPDISICDNCRRELYDPSDRRYRYPFINCTDCGPRYSIVTGVPYDRPLTTMSMFAMCPDCNAEYHEPSDRRFHAQPTACPICGPGLAFARLDADIEPIRFDSNDSYKHIDAAVDALKSGLVVAVKGLGGYHLACDATNDDAVSVLRERKRRSNKPFAVMLKDIGAARGVCEISDAEANLLESLISPIVLLDRKEDFGLHLSPGVSPGNGRLGVMLPYTSLHALLMARMDALVMTSANLSEEPIVTGNEEALAKLSGLADRILMHNRDIHMRVDDSVARVASGVPRLIRRARGYVPGTIDLGRDMPDILACGPLLKNTFTLTRGRYAITSQHIGDLESVEAMGFYTETLANMRVIFGGEPKVIAHDMHPDYLSTRFAADYAGETGAALIPVQHHHAHIASCMAENGFNDTVIGVAFDGTGYGTDGTIWGGEFLVADYTGFERYAHISPIPLPGGDRAILEPWRLALSALITAYGQDDGIVIFSELKPGMDEREVFNLARMIERSINSPLSSGMGRLFDAVSSLIGIMDVITFEGEAAIALETAATRAYAGGVTYPFSISDDDTNIPHITGTGGIIRSIIGDLRSGISSGIIARRFHDTVAEMVFVVCDTIRRERGLSTVALSGGVFQNLLLLEGVEAGLIERGFVTLTHSKLPANDGCVSLGQAMVAAAQSSM
jgi:hydrogenase maturation protein HypF